MHPIAPAESHTLPQGRRVTRLIPHGLTSRLAPLGDPDTAAAKEAGTGSWQRACAALRQARRTQWHALNGAKEAPEWLPSVADVAALPENDDPWDHWEVGGMLGLGSLVWDGDLASGNGGATAERRMVFSFLGSKGRSPMVDLVLYNRPTDMPKLPWLPFMLWPLLTRDGEVTFIHCEPFLECFLPTAWRKALAAEYGAKTAYFVLGEPSLMWRTLNRHYTSNTSFFVPNDHINVVTLPDGGEEELAIMFGDNMAQESDDLTSIDIPSKTFGDERDKPPVLMLENWEPDRAGGPVHQVFEREFLERYGVIPIWADLPTATLTLVASRQPDDMTVLNPIEDDLRNRFEGQVGAATRLEDVQHMHSTYVRMDNIQIEKFFRTGKREHINTNHLVERVVDALKRDNKLELAVDHKAMQIDEEELRQRSQGIGADPDVTHLLRELVSWGVNNDASDFFLSLHSEPPSRPGQHPRPYTRVSYKIDGQLVAHPSPIPPELAAPLIGALKAQSDIQSANRLQNDRDGFFSMNYQGNLYEVRVVVMPNSYSELAVCRFQNGSSPIRNFTDLGFREHESGLMLRALGQKNGLILVVGATGSGKTNTSWASYEAIDRTRRNVMSMEAPVERKIHLVEQLEATEFFAFARGTRAMMRAAPDVIGVGETRDEETLDAVCYAAETGHLVMTTLHANTSAAAPSRLVNISPPAQRHSTAFRVSEALLAVECQMLVPTLCRCAQMRDPLREQDLIEGRIPESLWDCFNPLRTRPLLEKNPQGCAFCRRSPGERGRTGLFEVYWVDKDIRKAIADMAPEAEIRALHYKQYVEDRQNAIEREMKRQMASMQHERVSVRRMEETEANFKARLAEAASVRSAQSILGQCIEKVLQGRVDVSRAYGLTVYER